MPDQIADDKAILLDAVVEGVTLQRPDGSLAYANTAAARLIGYSTPEALLAAPASEVTSRFEIFREDGRPLALGELPGRRALLGESPDEMLCRFRNRETGVERWAVVSARPIFDEAGRVRYALNLFRDMTDHVETVQAERRAAQEAERARERLEFLATASEALSQSLDLEATLDQVARLAVPRLADWYAIDLLEADDRVNRIALRHPDPAMVALAREQFAAHPPDPARIRAVTPTLIPEIDEKMIVAAARDDDHLAVLRQLDLRSAVVVPLQARGRILGQMTFILTRPDRQYDEADLLLANELAGRAALAVDNARLYREATTMNQQLEERVQQRVAQIAELNTQHARAERRFQDLLESAPDAIVIMDHDGRIVLANRQTEALFGHRRESLLGRPVEALIPGVSRFRHAVLRRSQSQDADADDMAGVLEMRGVHEDGSAFDIEVSLSPSGAPGTDEELIIAAVRDITQRQAAERALRESQALYETIAANLPDASIVVVTPDLRYQLARGPLLERLGFSPAGLEGQPVKTAANLTHVDQRLDAYRRALAGEATVQDIAVGGRKVQIQTTPLRDESGAIFAALAVSFDVTERTAAEDSTRALLRVSEKLNSSLELADIVDTMVLEAIRLTHAGGGFAGLVEGSVLKSSFFRFADETMPFDEEWPANRGVPGWVATHKRPYLTNNAADDPVVEPDFRERFELHSVLTVPILDKADTLLGLFQVVNKQHESGFTERDQRLLMGLSFIAAIALENARVYEQHRELSRRVMAAQDEERRRLSRELHDSAGQLLTVLTLQLSQLASAREFDPDDVRKQLREAVAFVQQAHGEIRAVSRNLRPPSLDLIGLNDALEELCRDFAARTSIKVTYQGADVSNLPDPIRLSFYRFLQETLANVARHSQAEHVQVTLIRRRDELILDVSDDGVGFSIGPEGDSGQSPSGLGLTSLRERFAMLKGTVSVESEPGKGARVIGRCRIPPI